MSGFLGSGDLYMDRLADDGSDTGFSLAGNATQFAIQEETETKERISTGRDTYGQALDTASIKKPAKISITLDELNKENLSMALLGDITSLSQGSGIGEVEFVTAKADKFVQLANANLAQTNLMVESKNGAEAVAWEASTAYALDAYIIPITPNGHYYKCTTAGTSDFSEPTWTTDGSTVTDGSAVWTDMGIIEYSATTDYTINHRVGLLQAVSTGNITDGEPLQVTYDFNAVSGSLINGSVKPTIKTKLMLDGRNAANGKSVIVHIDEAVLSPSSEVDFLSDDWTTLELEGTLKTLSGQTSPYSVELLD
jgi:hypothetical protein